MSNPNSMQIERARRTYRSLDIIRRYSLGDPVQEIADQYECGRRTVLHYARLAGLPKRPKHFPEEVRNSVIAQLKAKTPYKIIAKKYHCSEAYISKVATETKLRRYKTR